MKKQIRSMAKLCVCLFSMQAVTGCKTTAPDIERPENDSIYSRSLKSQVVRPESKHSGEIGNTLLGSASGPSSQAAPTLLGGVPSLSERSYSGAANLTSVPEIKVKSIDAFVPALPLNQFIDLVFGKMLDVPYVTGPGVANSQSVVQIRSSGQMSGESFFKLIEGALEEYGVRVILGDGVYQIIEDSALRSRIPEFIKSRARLRTRSDLRPVIQFVELQAIDPSSMQALLSQAFSRKTSKLSITAGTAQGYVALAGLPDEVDAAVAIIRELDELEFAGSEVMRFTPKYWDVTELSRELSNALKVEGWEVSTNVNLGRTIALLPIAFSNDLFVFAKTNEARNRVQAWMREFDRPIDKGDDVQLFVYQVQNVDASTLAATINSALAGSGATSGGDRLTGVAQSDFTRSGLSGQGPFTVDPIGNRLLFSGTFIEYEKMEGLLQTLDTPGPEVLIEVQIAEVTLGDSINFGFEIFDADILNGSGALALSTDGLGLGSSGVNANLITGDLTTALNVLASNRRVKVLSTPVLTARSGSSAQIQVGQDIPIITSQRAAESQDGIGGTDILQSVAYRATGVLLDIEPIVFSDNRIDLTISQEVSSELDSSTSAISSPTISNRSLSTQLSLEDGQTVVLGGLIQDTVVRDERGVPLLKDIPLVGSFFSNESVSVDRTELIILITAYVLRDQADKSQFVNVLSARVDRALRDDGRLLTLKPNGL